MYPDSKVESFISSTFIPVRFHVKENPEGFERFGAQWTPTILLLDPDGKERHRIEGFLPADDFLAQLHLGLGHAAFGRQKFGEASKHFDEVVSSFPKTESAAEALYWAGVSRYKESNDGAHLKATADAFAKRYSDSAWAKKASVWA